MVRTTRLAGPVSSLPPPDSCLGWNDLTVEHQANRPYSRTRRTQCKPSVGPQSGLASATRVSRCGQRQRRAESAMQSEATKPSHRAKHSMAPGHNTNKAMIRDHLTRQTGATTGRSHRRDIGPLAAPSGRRARMLECDALLPRLAARFCSRQGYPQLIHLKHLIWSR